MNAPVILKKYGNRRLYDARRSGYVTLAEVAEMLRRGEDVQVIDARSGEDLTKAVLVQIILEAEGSREALPTAFLKQVVRLGDSPLRESFARGLGSFLEGFLDMQRETQRNVVDAQRDFGAQMQKWAMSVPALSLFANPFAAFAPPPPRPEAPPAPRPDDEDLRRLKEELAETQSLVRELLVERRAEKEEGAVKKPRRAVKAQAGKTQAGKTQAGKTQAGKTQAARTQAAAKRPATKQAAKKGRATKGRA